MDEVTSGRKPVAVVYVMEGGRLTPSIPITNELSDELKISPNYSLSSNLGNVNAESNLFHVVAGDELSEVSLGLSIESILQIVDAAKIIIDWYRDNGADIPDW